MFSIGNLHALNRIIAAPLAGVSDRAFRTLAARYGCGLAYSEMISDMGLCYGQRKTLALLDNSGTGIPVIIQIFGSEPASMGKAAAIAQERGAPAIDINMGCPVPKVVKSGEGSALLLDLPKCRRIIAAVVKSVTVPVAVKMRLGWDEEHLVYLELGRIAEEEGASAVALHPRTRQQFFAGQSDWSHITALKSALSIPVIGNGDIWSAEDALRMVQTTGCDAVMIGRGALGNPFLFAEAAALLEEGIKLPAPARTERLAAARLHLEMAIAIKGEYVGVREMRKHMGWYIKGMSGAARLREMFNHAGTAAEMLEVLDLVAAREQE